jgi:hypothetical protein
MEIGAGLFVLGIAALVLSVRRWRFLARIGGSTLFVTGAALMGRSIRVA